MTTRPHILIATPVLNETVTLAYAKSLFRLQNHLRRSRVQIDLTMGTLVSAGIDTARNYFATHMLENTSFSHLLFVDADHGFRPELIIDMLELDEPVVGAVYPARDLQFEAVWQIARSVDAPDRLQSLASRYVLPRFHTDESGNLIAKRGFVRASMAGTGIMLIQRHVFDRMAMIPGLMGLGAEIMVKDGYSGRFLQCFRPIVQDNNLPLGEDLSFCLRWIEICGGEIWVSVDHEIEHVGAFAYTGRYRDRMK